MQVAQGDTLGPKAPLMPHFRHKCQMSLLDQNRTSDYILAKHTMLIQAGDVPQLATAPGWTPA